MIQNVLDQVANARLLPVVVLGRVEDAVPLGRALVDGGLPVAEITFRSDAAEASIRAIAAEVPEILLGAGTVLTEDQVRAAAAAGAQFLVTPGFNPAVVRAAKTASLPIVPGVNNPTGVEMAMAEGLNAVKFFPAEATGGVPFLKALSGPYKAVRFIPTGGVGLSNLSQYLALPSVLACGGSWMVDSKLIEAGRFDEITKLTAAAVAAAKDAAS
ncbi:bifunctional 4-hydroxy-2-oxoglutarate aldolase/2-dehydro-3-deoxy-phosphogluconate aldolase [Gymnodinialimonas hymeniacidonis]|uniref:bifunctional 4-hydroxy-2-oxoglutarate aldolase/2-dehydro-3-deoxy-phosphogluconate aldolase n=1 Tax=Gymnodinialimonas hymeniacidonis TaxID=3126508 RepID=UPI0034C6CB00